ncbi:putative short chain dehydrogenase [Rosellinia necatrix]|uniref:Putative short chain dehydrogenase n=1 Tax=Rosellinia necatrix TaxID=77044 RepID=A0A1W2TCE6_ROSNE|nr:putative short chain dehydrogenase [Rosellinia necatrix]
MQPPFPCPVETWHNDTYEAISPTRPELSVAGKTVVILGAGSGIGRETALAFAVAGASKVALLGRTEATLRETASKIEEASKSSTIIHVADITDEDGLKQAATAIGKWNVLVISSGFCPTPSPIVSSEVGEWWKGFETNVKGTLLAAKAFLPTADRPDAAFLGVISDVSILPAAFLQGLSPYISSKLAQSKVFEFIAAENPDIFVATMHPGMVETDNFNRTGASADQLPMDKVQLPAHFLVWMVSPEAVFLRGRCASANWDVEELKALKAKFTDGLFMTFGSKGFP